MALKCATVLVRGGFGRTPQAKVKIIGDKIDPIDKIPVFFRFIEYL